MRDFYGTDAYEKGAEFLRNIDEDEVKQYGMVGYLVKNTITENGSVKRGVCEQNDGKLTKIVESKVERINGKIIASPLSGAPEFEVREDQTVSMNMLLFTPSIFEYIEKGFPKFLDDQEDLMTCEYLIPDVLQETIEVGYATAEVIPTTASWYGVTYKEDTEKVRDALKTLVKKKEYPNNLWN